MNETSHRVAGLSDRLRKVRETSGLSQKAFASALSIPVRTWQSYEKGEASPPAQVLASLETQGISSRWILTGEGVVRYAEERPGQVVDVDLLANVIDGVTLELKAQGIVIDHKKMAEVVALIYDIALVRNSTGTKEAIARVVKLAE